VVLGQDEGKTIGVRIKSTTGFEPEVHPYDYNQPNHIEMNFLPPNLTIRSFGEATSQLMIRVPHNIESGQYPLPILASLTIPPLSIIKADSNGTMKDNSSGTNEGFSKNLSNIGNF
jgi:hypothetical protein